MKNTRRNILVWFHDNISHIVREVVDVIYKDHWVSEGLLCGGIPAREFGFLIPRKVAKGQSLEYIFRHSTGDGGHGISFWQIDDRSYPDWLSKHQLSDTSIPIDELIKAYCIKSVECLIEKEKYLVSKGYTREKLGDETFERAIIAAYNCGQGNVAKALRNGYDVDRYTYQHDYSKDVQTSRALYNNIYYPDVQPNETAGGEEEILVENAKAIEGHLELLDNDYQEAKPDITVA